MLTTHFGQRLCRNPHILACFGQTFGYSVPITMVAVSQITSVRITDPDICRIIAEEQRRRGDATASKTAGKIVTEWQAQQRLIEAAPSSVDQGAQQNVDQPSTFREDQPTPAPQGASASTKSAAGKRGSHDANR